MNSTKATSLRRKLVAMVTPTVLAASMIVIGAPAAHADAAQCIQQAAKYVSGLPANLRDTSINELTANIAKIVSSC